MADTIVNTPQPQQQSDSSAGWAVAVIILLVVIIGGGYYFLHHRVAPAAPAGTTVQVNLPTGGGSGTGSTGGTTQ
jgi:hypothetical protein